MIKNPTQIRQEANILDVIGKFVTLKRRGTVHIGLCPFHNEKTPSFTVFPNTNRFKCFGCGEGGDAVHFLIEHKDMTYSEALEYAASECRIEVEYEDRERRKEQIEQEKQEKERSKALREVLQQSHRFLSDQGPLQETYCDLKTKETYVDAAGRSLKKSTAETFGLCLSPNTHALRQAGFWKEQDLLDAGLLGDGQYGKYDFFRNRLLFRITNHRGEIAGLAGRKLPDDTSDAPKYLNPRETILYQKSEVLFGLHENKQGIKEAGFITLVEGYFDVITPHDYGIKNCVATCGTALTEGQARLLARYTEKVVILSDGDSAGQKAAANMVEILLREGLQVDVLPLAPPDTLLKKITDIEERLPDLEKEAADAPEGKEKERAQKLLNFNLEDLQKSKAELDAHKDPDTFVRHHGKRGFEFFVENCVQDAVIWRVMLDYDESDVFKKETATNIAASLLALIDSDVRRDYYIRELCKKENLGSVKIILKNAVEKHTQNKGKKTELTPKQKQDVISYGIYERDQKYWLTHDISGSGYAISNFIIKPIVFIEGAKESIRLVEVINEKSIARIIDINSRNFVELGPFKQSVEARGNFRFEGKPTDFGKVKAKVYDMMSTAFPINTLGLHKEGFFAFANGIVHQGRKYQVDEYGLVGFGSTKYYLPAFSKIRDHIKSDDVDNEYEDEQYYVFTDAKPSIDWKAWTGLMLQVHGDNALIAILYYCAVMIREKVFERLDNMFPHLNFFGLPGSGKNQLAASLIVLFGKYRPPVHIANASDAAFFRRIAQVRNGIAWYDEYSNNIDFERREALKQFADGTGRSLAQATNNNRTRSSAVAGACLITGQQQPTSDIALFQRCVSLNFSKTSYTNEEQEFHSRLKSHEKNGTLTNFTIQLHSHREYLLDNFLEEFDAALERMKILTASHSIMDRMLRSYTVLLTMYNLLKDKMPFAFSLETTEEILMKTLITQKENVFSENEVSIWWRMIEQFIDNDSAGKPDSIEHGNDIIVEEVSGETYDLDWSGSKESKVYPAGTRLLYVNFSRSHPLYVQTHHRQRGVRGLELEALRHYLRASYGYEGWKRAKKFNRVNKTVYVFDVSKLPFELEDTIVVLDRKTRLHSGRPEDTDKKVIQPDSIPDTGQADEEDLKKVIEELPF